MPLSSPRLSPICLTDWPDVPLLAISDALERLTGLRKVLHLCVFIIKNAAQEQPKGRDEKGKGRCVWGGYDASMPSHLHPVFTNPEAPEPHRLVRDFDGFLM